ncbi:hypothetical protein AB9F41_34020, partial [Rhizobium leguminosarum]
GTTAIAGDNPVVAKKAAAKADVEAARQAKANAINADKNLTQAEKDAAKAEAKKLADAELAKVNAQPDNAETAEAAAAAQKLVNDAEDKGVADVT